MKRKSIVLGIVLVLILWILIVGIYHFVKPLPEGVDYTSEFTGDVEFLYDLTYMKDNESAHEQQIFDRVFEEIDNAENYVLIDMFLFNSHMNGDNVPYRYLTQELTDKLIAKKMTSDIDIDFITDGINNVYGGDNSEQLVTMTDAGINVIITDIKKLRDSNPIYSTFWRTFIQWFGVYEGGILKHPFGEGKVGFRSYLTLLNFKANHRKVFIADNDAMVMSANPHDGSSAHSNVAFLIKGAGKEFYKAESYVAKFSGGKLSDVPFDEPDGDAIVKILTENSIERELIDTIDSLEEGDDISMAMFYLSDRDVVKSILRASERGVDINIILDANRDAFGYEKNGVPNRQVAHELIKKSDGKINIRWYDTHGEQFHTKIIIIHKGDVTIVFLGSANLTKRNIDNYNLEMNVKVIGSSGEDEYFRRIWENIDGHYTVDYEEYEDYSFFKTLMYRFQEFTGLCSF